MLNYVNITDRQTHQNYSSEPHKPIEFFGLLTVLVRLPGPIFWSDFMRA